MNTNQLIQQLKKVSERYAEKYNVDRDDEWFILKLQEELGELIQSYLMMVGKARTKGKTSSQLTDDFRKEVADVFCHVLLLAEHHRVDLKKEVENKWLKQYIS